MTSALACYRCGSSLAKLTLPLARLDECPACHVELHVCRMCQHYDPRVALSCTEDDALEVKDKRKPNFCDFFRPNPDAYEPGEFEAARRAQSDLAALFGDARSTSPDEDTRTPAQKAADALFKK
jgi:hypothetical protein